MSPDNYFVDKDEVKCLNLHRKHKHSSSRPRAISQPSTSNLFPLLPYEIRLQIWKAIAMTPRLIEILPRPICTKATDERVKPEYRHLQACHYDIRVLRKGLHCVYTLTAPPSLLSINRESRATGLKYYELSFVSKFDANCSGPGIYLNFEVDIICFSTLKVSKQQLQNRPLIRPRARFPLQQVQLLSFGAPADAPLLDAYLAPHLMPSCQWPRPNQMLKLRFLRLYFYHEPHLSDSIWSRAYLWYYPSLEQVTLLWNRPDEEAGKMVKKCGRDMWRVWDKVWKVGERRPVIVLGSAISGNSWVVLGPDERLGWT